MVKNMVKKSKKAADIHPVFLEILSKILKHDREIYGVLTEGAPNSSN